MLLAAISRAYVEMGREASAACLILVDYQQPRGRERQENNCLRDVLAVSDYFRGLVSVPLSGSTMMLAAVSGAIAPLHWTARTCFNLRPSTSLCACVPAYNLFTDSIDDIAHRDLGDPQLGLQRPDQKQRNLPMLGQIFWYLSIWFKAVPNACNASDVSATPEEEASEGLFVFGVSSLIATAIGRAVGLGDFIMQAWRRQRH